MNEAYLQYIWRHKKLPVTNLNTTNNESIEILDFGFLNSDSGPDFFNGKIKIANQIWAGNIEVHVKSSEWYLHKHQFDVAYDNVILHVVHEYDGPVFNSSGFEIPTLVVKPFVDVIHFNNYKDILLNEGWVPCEKQIQSIDAFYTKSFLERLTVERVARKSSIILSKLQKSKYNWEENFYQNFMGSFGSKVNQEAFMQIAQQTPLSIIQKIGSNEFELEALFLGQASLLEDEIQDDYYLKLKSEYLFLKNKFNLSAIAPKWIKFSKLRPPNFPTIRLVQFSKIMAKRNQWFAFLMEADLNQVEAEFDVDVDGYWENHYTFGKTSVNRPKRIGATLVNNIKINLVAPFLLMYSEYISDESIKEKAFDILEKTSPESNSLIDKWSELGVHADTAFHTQALLELKNEYCSAKKCLNCSIGVKILNR